MEGVATTYSGRCLEQGLEEIEALETFQCVFRAGGVESTPCVWAEDHLFERRNQAVSPNEDHEGKGE
jgi:hypothetical protein